MHRGNAHFTPCHTRNNVIYQFRGQRLSLCQMGAITYADHSIEDDFGNKHGRSWVGDMFLFPKILVSLEDKKEL